MKANIQNIYKALKILYRLLHYYAIKFVLGLI